MIITLKPKASLVEDISPIISGEVLTYRGESYNLSQLPEGGIVEADTPFIGNITRLNGQLQVKLQYCYHMEKAEDHQSLNWDDYTFVVTEGQCPCPIKFKPEPEQNSGAFEA